MSLAVATVVVFWAYAAEPTEPGTLQVYPRPDDAVGSAAALVAADLPGAEANPDSPTRQPQARVQLTLSTIARPLRLRASEVRCELVAGEALRGEPGRWVAGTAATPLTRQPRGLQLARFEIGGVPHYRVVRLKGREAGVVPVRRGMARVVRGRVLDADGEPLASAQVWLAGATATTGEGGGFETEPIPVGNGMPLVVQAKGLASMFRILGAGECLTLDARPITMNRRGTRLLARFFSAAAPADLRFFILPAGGREAGLLSYPLFLPAVVPVPVAEDGSVSIEGLPWGVRIRLMVQHPAGPTVLSEELVMDRFEVRCVLHGGSARQLAGRVVDARGRAVEGAFLTARAGGTGLVLKAGTWLLPGAAYIQDAAVGRSARDGSFALPLVWGAARRGLISVEAAGLVGLEYSIPAGATPPKRLVLYEMGGAGKPELVLQAKDLPAFVHVLVRNDGGQQGPFPWSTDAAFEIPLRRTALVEVVTQVDDGQTRTHTVFVDGRRPLQVSR
ncbi:MAG: carboxypeptidase-like regulatory domain-containing protein [Planctomycetota bacterium]|nr:carboxypeptidase-like regulatory domain-containing protein [Planctomycetota bacterium]